MTVIGRLSRGWQLLQTQLTAGFAKNSSTLDNAIPTTTRFFRNKPLISEVFALIGAAHLPHTRLFFHACSSGEEPYSYVMHNLLDCHLPISVAAADYHPKIVDTAQRGVYPRHVIDESNAAFITANYRHNFKPQLLNYTLSSQVRQSVDRWLVIDYTDDGNDWVTCEAADMVFCNSSLLYHPLPVQALVLDRLCRQATQALIITGADNAALETVLPQHGFAPHRRNWERIYDGCPLRRISMERPYKTPTTPYLTDRDRATEQFFRYTIFLRAGSALALAAAHLPPV